MKFSFVTICLSEFSNQQFLDTISISSDRPIKLFVRVKERIIPDKCTFTTTPTLMEIKLFKENSTGARWGRLEPNEYTETRPPIQQSPPSSNKSKSIS
jgi:hypothetical protein